MDAYSFIMHIKTEYFYKNKAKSVEDKEDKKAKRIKKQKEQRSVL